jgi:diadenosine tetraphosphatase ApaH/serine/threonine PP2A family protein phosphatase
LILNPGSVGQPRDGNPHASWGILDLERRTFAVHRSPYDVKETEFKMHNLGMPSEHSARLKIGA